ncbi:MAG: DNA polymerase III subunit gamma/tau [Patescibacteria group bacterium]|nr:DNA polymerase III subunit gamma/tau [Patescibacteria group bacterium]
MVFYRRYRPQKIEELDSQAVREELFSVLSKASFSHAFLFTGPKGLGKTSTARIVAKVINCEKHKNLKGKLSEKAIEPCNKCEQCLSITNGTNMDVLEIDGASNRGIDEIRDLRDKVKLAPFKAAKKVYIIDEVHMLTTEAFNALLKTLEEPPSHVVFILCTTEPHKVPATILSRCFRIVFKQASDEELVRSFQRIVKAEKLLADTGGLKAIAGLSDGSFRDGVKVLEEISVIANGKKITKELVEKKYKLTNVEKQITDLLSFLKEKDSQKAFKLISEMVETGVDAKYFLEQLINKLHLGLLEKVGVSQESDKDMGFEIHEIKKLVELFSKAYLDIKYAVLEQLPLELAIVEWVSESESGADFTRVEGDAQQSSEEKNKSQASLNESRSTKATENSTSKSSPTFNSPSNDKTNTALKDLFEELVEKVKPYNHSVAGVLRGCSIKSYKDKKLIIETSYKFHKERLEEAKTRRIIEDVASEITGNKVNLYVSLRG